VSSPEVSPPADCEVNNICFYSEENFKGQRESFVTPSECKDLNFRAKSAYNNTGSDVELRSAANCVGSSHILHAGSYEPKLASPALSCKTG
jgi:hypothetical protein